MSCSCQTAEEPVSLALLNATIAATNTKLDELIAVLSGRLLSPVVSSGNGAFAQYIGAGDLWTYADVDTHIRAEIAPYNNADGAQRATTISLNVGPSANSDSEVNVAEQLAIIPIAGTGIHYKAIIQGFCPKGYYYRVDASTSVSDGIDPTQTRIIRTMVKA